MRHSVQEAVLMLYNNVVMPMGRVDSLAMYSDEVELSGHVESVGDDDVDGRRRQSADDDTTDCRRLSGDQVESGSSRVDRRPVDVDRTDRVWTAQHNTDAR